MPQGHGPEGESFAFHKRLVREGGTHRGHGYRLRAASMTFDEKGEKGRNRPPSGCAALVRHPNSAVERRA